MYEKKDNVRKWNTVQKKSTKGKGHNVCHETAGWQQEAGELYAEEQAAHKHAPCKPRERARLGLLLLWCNGDCAVGSERGVEWVPSTVEGRQPPTVPRRDRLEAGRRWQGPVPTPYMETRIQVCLLAPQLAVSWRLETFLTHLCDVAATRERRHQHPICSEPEPSEVRRGCCCFIDNLLGLVALSSPHRAPVDPFVLRAGPPWLRGAPPGCWRWC